MELRIKSNDFLSCLSQNELLKLKEQLDYWITRHGDPSSIDTLDMSVRTYNCLKSNGIKSLYQISDFYSHEFVSIRNLGRKSFKEVESLMDRYNIKFKP